MTRAIESAAGFEWEFVSPSGAFSVIIDDDGRVGYAYLLDIKGQIRGDVWLYNRCGAPLEPEWLSRDGAPYANPAAYVDEDTWFVAPDSPIEFAVLWDENPGPCQASLLFRGALVAKLMEGAMPGWCVSARMDGPLAKIFKLS